MHLDGSNSGTPDALYYTVDTSQGNDHRITLRLKQQPDNDATDDIEVVWNGEVIHTLDPSKSWGVVTVHLPDTNQDSTNLVLREVSDQNDGLGALIDEITLTKLSAETVNNEDHDEVLDTMEGSRIGLNLNIEHPDDDGSESLEVILSGIPTGFELSDGTNTLTSNDSDLEITGWNYASLVLTPTSHYTDDFIITVNATSTENSGGESQTETRTLLVDVRSENNKAVISGDYRGNVTEDSGVLTTSATLTVSDQDAGEQNFVAQTLNGNYGTLTIDAQGNWTYEVDNDHSYVQGLGEGWTTNDTIEVQSVDGTTFNVVITLIGTNDAAVITGTSTGSVTEDSDDTLVVEGVLTVEDTDSNESVFQEETIEGDYGSLTIDENGQWTYEADGTQTVIQSLGEGDSLTETLTVQSEDGTTQDIVITINGFNDSAVISGELTGSVDEDASATLTASGVLTIEDPDAGNDQLIAETVNGTYGSLTVDEDGNWNYSADTNQDDIQALGEGMTLTDTLTIRSVDGTEQDIVITINGTNDEAVIGGATTGSVTEDDSTTLTTSGTLTIDDPDSTTHRSVRLDDDEGGYTSKGGVSLGEDLDKHLDFGADSTFDGFLSNSASWSFGFRITSPPDNDSDDMTLFGIEDDTGDTSWMALDWSSDSTAYLYVGHGDAYDLSGMDNSTPLQEGDFLHVSFDGSTLNIYVNGELRESSTDLPDSLADSTSGTVTFGKALSENLDNWEGGVDELWMANGAAVPATASSDQRDNNNLEDASWYDEVTHWWPTGGDTFPNIVAAKGDVDGTLVNGEESDFEATGSEIGSGQDAFQPETLSGTYGSLTIDTDGNWSYSADGNQTEIQALGADDTLTDTVTVTTVDGSEQSLIITITGTNDAPEITGTKTGEVTENDGDTLTTSGTLAITDVDTDESEFVAETVNGTYGSITIDAAGEWTYSADDSQTAIDELDDGDSLTDTLQVRAADGTTHDITITINGTNDAPTAASNTVTLDEDGSHTFTVANFGFSDVDDGDSFQSLTITRLPADGSLTLNGEAVTADQQINSGDIGNLVFTPAANANGDSYADLQFTVSDGTASSNVQTLTLDVTAVNDAPTAADNTVTLDEDTTHTFAASEFGFSDIDDGDSLQSVTITRLPADGSLTLNGEAVTADQVISVDDIDNLVFSPEANANGSGYADFQFTVSDGGLSSAVQTMTFDVNAVSDAAVISGETSGDSTEDDADTLTVTGVLSVTDQDAGEAQFTAETIDGTYGSLSIDAEGNWSYSADNSQDAIQALGDGDTLTDTLTIQSVDGTTEDIVITINGVNDAAQISGDDSGSVTEDAASTLTTSGALSITDTDADEASFTAETVTGTYGSLTIDADGNWSYSADNSQSDIDSLGNGDTLTDTLQVRSVDGTTHDVVITINGTNDTPELTAASDDFEYTENDDNAQALSELTVSDPDSTLHSAVVRITDNYVENEDSLSFTNQNGISGEWDAEEGTLTLTGEASVANYQTALRSLVYTNNSDSPSTETRTLGITVNDGETDSAQASQTIAITRVNDVPEITGVGPQIDETMDTANREGTSQHIQVRTSGMGFNTGQVIELTFTNSEDSSEVYTLSYTVGTNRTDSQVARALAEAIDTDPEIGDLFSFVNDPVNSSYMNVLEVDDPNRAPFTLATSISDADGNEVSTQNVLQNPTRVNGVDYNGEGNAAIAQVESFTIPDALEEGQAVRLYVDGLEASYTVADGDSPEDVRDALIDDINANPDLSDIVSVQANGSDGITLTANKPGIAFNGFGISTPTSGEFTLTAAENVALNSVVGAVGASDKDGDTDTLSYALLDDADGKFTIDSETGVITVSGELDHEAAQSHTVTVEVTDSQGAKAQQEVGIKLTNVNEAPEGEADSDSVNEDDVLTIDVLSNDTDIDNADTPDNFSLDAVEIVDEDGNTLTGKGSVSIVDNQLRFDPGTDFNQLAAGTTETVTVRYEMSDDEGLSSESTVTITVNGTNDAPTTSDDTITLDEDGSHTFSTSNFAFSDVDDGDSLQSVTITRLPGAGSLTLNGEAVTADQEISESEIGNLVFTPAANANGESYADLSFTVSDGTESSAEQTLTFDVTAIADTASISGDDTGSVTEDAATTLTTSGTLSVSDPDAGEAEFTAETVNGTYGSLEINAAGEWSYSSDTTQSAIQALNEGDSLTDTLQVIRTPSLRRTSASVITIGNDYPSSGCW